MSLECPLCGEEFKEDEKCLPKLLKCGDTLCINCIKEKCETEKIICPLCEQNTNQTIEDIPTNKYAIQLKKSILCDKCLQEYSHTLNGERIPKVLKCGDTFCLACLKGLYKEGKIRCPFCGIESTDDIKEFPINKCITEKAENELLNNVKYLTKKNLDLKDLNHQFSLGLMGESNGGKTCITHYFHTGESLVNSAISTIGFDYYYKYISINKKLVKVSLLDTAGQERFGSISAGALRGVHGLLLVFALTIDRNDTNVYDKWKSLEGEEKKALEEEITKKKIAALEFWLEQFEQFNQQEKRVIYLIGNKVDDEENRIVKKKDAKAFAVKYNLKYFETSAKTGYNIFKVFENLIIDLIELYPKKIEKRGTMLTKERHTSSFWKKICCFN